MTKLPIVSTKAPYMGCDPEFFFKVDNDIIGAEKIFDKDGLNVDSKLLQNAPPGTKSKFIIDGVQAELNPRPDTCRAHIANEIKACFITLKAELDKKHKNVQCDFSRSITISKEKLAELDEKNQKFGCMPSNNAYKNSGIKLEDVDATKHMQRSAGGHIHIGKDRFPELAACIKERPDEMVQILDIICGNTCVLIDRDEGNKERRKLYGRAGEYRLPPHGFEYRTLSNFWLESYPLMSLAFGLVRLAIELISDPKNSQVYYKAFTEAVDMNDIQKAINENNFDLAYSNFKKIEPLLKDVVGRGFGHHAIDTTTMPEFHYFIGEVKTRGMKHFFKDDPVKHWCELPEAHTGGFHDFLNMKIRPMRQIAEKAATLPLAEEKRTA